MRPFSLASSVLACVYLAHAQLLPFSFSSSSVWSKLSDNKVPSKPQLQSQQKPLMDSANSGPGIQLPPSSDGSHPRPPPTGDVIISDVIGNTRQINIFAGFTRDIDTVASRLDSENKNTTVLAPVNSAISALPRKPWEDPREYAALGTNAYHGQDGEDRAHRNLRTFTEAHVIPQSPWKQGEKVQTLGGNTVWWEEKNGKAYVQPGDVEIERVVSRVKNGEVWMLKGALNYAS